MTYPTLHSTNHHTTPLPPNPTLYSTVVMLVATQGGTMPATQGRLAQAAFLDIIRGVDPDLAEALHVKHQRRPYTVSPLQKAGGPIRNGQITIRSGQAVWLRFTLLGSDLFATFLRHFLTPMSARQFPTLRLGTLDFALGDILTTPGSHEWANYTTLEDLCQRWPAVPDKSAQRITLNFASPTVFSRNSDKDGMGKFMEPWPSPPMLFGSLAARWNDFMPMPVDKQAVRDYATETVVVGHYQMEARTYRYWGNPQIGAVGQVTYLLKDKRDADMIRTLNLLADYAFYSGVGYKTAMGMGQVRRIMNYEG